MIGSVYNAIMYMYRIHIKYTDIYTIFEAGFIGGQAWKIVLLILLIIVVVFV